MRVVLIGSGGREHAIAYKITESKLLDELFIIPGNPGTKLLGENININPADHESILKFCKENKIDLAVIGPEQPLVDGLGDVLRKNNIKVFGPNSNAAEIEAHKSFSKFLMKKYSIPTAEYEEFTSSQIEEAKEYLKKNSYPIVIKADGLAAGKGVLICSNLIEAEKAIDNLFIDKIFGKAGEKIIIEEFMRGEEASVFAITDGNNFICLPAAQDHKRAGEGDTGKNTGGMGAYAPAPIITEKLRKEVEEKIIRPTLEGMKNEGREFSGCLYCGIMLTEYGPKVVEFNCRFGDPETQVVLPILKGDFLQLLYSASAGKLDASAVVYDGSAAVCVVAASKGYPDSYEKGYAIEGLDNVDEGVIVFHAGTKVKDKTIITNGGRVLSITAVVSDNNLKLAKQNAYNGLSKINFEGIYYRKDISDKAQ